MTTADDELAAWLSNGEMAKHNNRGPARTALPIVVNGQAVERLGNPNQFRYEHDLQVAVFDWADTAVTSIPELEMLYAIPNGGHRSKATAGKMKAEGQRAGVWDCVLDVARGGHHSLKIELKVGTNKLTKTQQVWGERYARYGHKTAVCCDLDSVKQVIVEYLNL